MCGNSHNCARSVTHEDIIRNPYGNLIARCRVNCSDAFKRHACFFLCKLAALEIALVRRLFTISVNGLHICNLISHCVHDRMLGCNYHICCTEQRIRASGEYAQSFGIPFNFESYFRTDAAADPVFLR